MKLDELKKMIEILRAAPEDQSEDYPVMTHSDVERLTFPCKLYQVDGYSEDMEAKVVEVTALAYNLADGATVKTVLFRREADRQRARSSVEMFYATEENARIECDEINLMVAAQRVEEKIANHNLPLLTRMVAMEELLQEVQHYVNRFPESPEANRLSDRVNNILLLDTYRNGLKP